MDDYDELFKLAKGRDLHALLEEVHDRGSFLVFVAALIHDRRLEDQIEKVNPTTDWGPGAMGWENGTVEAFLDAGLSGFLCFREYREPSWKAFAHFLYLGKYYE